jgi:signal transduction histidine kinase
VEIPPSFIETWCQRYLRWAEVHFYPRLPERIRAQVIELDRRVLDIPHLGGWVGASVGAIASCMGFSVGLHAAGVAWGIAIFCGVALAAGFIAAMVSAWNNPERYTLRRIWRVALLMMLGVYAGSLGSIVSGAKNAGKDQSWFDAMVNAVWVATPFQLIAGLLLLAMLWIASGTRRQHLQQALQRATLAQERDAAARGLAEAQLRLLQAQIEPHFLFNTLATLQHWVDTRDERAPALLRTLTTFLRASTEMFDRAAVSLGDECTMARHYLDIMQARLGPRLRHSFDVAPGCEAETLPPGLLMTLVENAVEHGIEPSLQGGTLRVRARCDGGACELRVEDDGAGLHGEVHDGIGLANCRERLRHRFGDAATLSLQTREGGGTQAVVRWPAAARNEP